MKYFWHILVMINIYVALASSLNIAVGYTGLLSLCHAAFYGLGAYITTLLIMKAGLGFLPALVVAMLFTAVLSLIIAVPSLRLRGDYFVLGTLGFQIIVFSVLYNWMGVTRGPYGISGIPAPNVLDLEIDSVPLYFLFSLVLVLASLGAMWLLISSPFGRLLRAVRDDEIAAASLGKNVPRIRATAFAIAAAFAAVPGALFAGYVRYIDPTSFTLTEAIFILSIVVIGGAGDFRGPIVGAVLLIILPELLRFLQVSDSMAANLRQIIYGLLLVVLMRLRSRGLMGDYGFE